MDTVLFDDFVNIYMDAIKINFDDVVVHDIRIKDINEFKDCQLINYSFSAENQRMGMIQVFYNVGDSEMLIFGALGLNNVKYEIFKTLVVYEEIYCSMHLK